MKVVYNGPHDAVEPQDAPGVVAVRGEEVELPEAVAKRLLEQDTWSTKESKADREKREQAEKDEAELIAAAEKAAAEARAKVAAAHAKRDQKAGS